MNLQDILSVAATVVVSLGGGGAITFGLSNWLGRVWADRLMQAERAQHEHALERLRAELRTATESELEQFRSRLQGEMDALLRRRQIYERIGVAMRVFLSGSTSAASAAEKESQQQEFLKAYDLSMLWAPDPVVDAIGGFLDLMIAQAAQAGSVPQEAMRQAYTRCLLEMRRDAGFPKTPVGSYRVVSF